MTNLQTAAECLNRSVKIALDTGEASSIEEAERMFAAYRLQIAIGPDVAFNSVLQAALLTAVNCAARTFLGGVTVMGLTGPLMLRLPPFVDLERAVNGLGGKWVERFYPDIPTLVIGDFNVAAPEPLTIRATFAGWSAGVMPVASQMRLTERGAFTPAGVLAGAIGVSEIFQRVRGGNPMACRRSVGLDLWRPERDWLHPDGAPVLDHLPSAAWLVGLGNLGQAYLWTLGLLPYGEKGAELVLQDVDLLAASNLSTSLLTMPSRLGARKTRAMAEWAERRGFKTSIIERNFDADFRVGPREPAVALIGVDNGLARQAIEEVGFERVIEAGLGHGPQDFLGFDLHTFPASKSARELWRDVAASATDIAQPAYASMFKQTKDRCGIVQLASRSVGAPFVGAAAAALVIAEFLRLTLGGNRYEIISGHLRDLSDRTTVGGAPWPAFNPGRLALAA